MSAGVLSVELCLRLFGDNRRALAEDLIAKNSRLLKVNSGQLCIIRPTLGKVIRDPNRHGRLAVS